MSRVTGTNNKKMRWKIDEKLKSLQVYNSDVRDNIVYTFADSTKGERSEGREQFMQVRIFFLYPSFRFPHNYYIIFTFEFRVQSATFAFQTFDVIANGFRLSKLSINKQLSVLNYECACISNNGKTVNVLLAQPTDMETYETEMLMDSRARLTLEGEIK